jgi:hypothetical protein
MLNFDVAELIAGFLLRFAAVVPSPFFTTTYSQDTNVPQFALARLLKGGSTSLFVVGDNDQMIYSW